MITTGNSETRPFAYAIYKASQKKSEDHLWNMMWTANTKKQFDMMTEYFNPDPVDTVSFHLQHGSVDGSKRYILELDMFGKRISSEEYFKAYYDLSKKLKKGCFFGEFGDMLEMESAPDVIDKFKEVTEAISDSGIQIAALWQFQDYTDEGVAGEKLAVLSELNKKLVSDGKQDKEKAWAQKEEITETKTETETETVAAAPETETEKIPEDDPKKDNTPLTAAIIAASAVLIAGIVTAVLIINKKRKKQNVDK